MKHRIVRLPKTRVDEENVFVIEKLVKYPKISILPFTKPKWVEEWVTLGDDRNMYGFSFPIKFDNVEDAKKYIEKLNVDTTYNKKIVCAEIEG